MKKVAKHRNVNREVLSPSRRFAGYNENWIEYNYGEIYTFKRTNSLSRDKLNYSEGLVKNIHYGDIHTKFKTGFDISKEEVPFVNSEIDLSRVEADDYCQESDLVIADASEDYDDVGKTIEIIHLNNEKLLAGLHTYIARPDSKLMVKGFGGYLVQSNTIRAQVKILCQGTKVLGISSKRLSEVIFKIPSRPEQQKIVDFLSSVDNKIQVLMRKKELLEKYKKGLMQQVFPSKEESLPSLRFKGADGSAYGEWEEKRLGDVVKFSRGKGISKADIEKGAANPCIRYGELYTRYDEMIDTIYSFTNLKKKNLIVSETNDVIIPSSGETNIDIATASCVLLDGVILGGDLNILKTKINGVFLAYYMNNSLKYEIAKYGQGVSVVHLYSSSLKLLKLLIPLNEEQTHIANFLTTIDEKINAVVRQIEQMGVWKKGLLQQMFV